MTGLDPGEAAERKEGVDLRSQIGIGDQWMQQLGEEKNGEDSTLVP